MHVSYGHLVDFIYFILFYFSLLLLSIWCEIKINITLRAETTEHDWSNRVTSLVSHKNDCREPLPIRATYWY